ncbi:MAG: patatin-like phospholipase family protein [Sphaerochaetaceae bacterium]|nr:patatin-like phospholipase family protein [Sphaerochaetaceae bacterium]
MKPKRYFIIAALIVLFSLVHLSAVQANSNSSSDLLDAVVPFEYGIERFEQRIAASRQGEEPVGLLLSGGSARAFAHIGVIKAFEELGITPDYLVTNSMGSIVGILYAAGLNSDQIYDIVKNIDPGTLFAMTYPFEGGLIDPLAFIDFIFSYLSETPELEQLEIPIIVITEDVRTKRQVLIAEGDVRTVLAASFALPVYFPPVEFRGHLLLDGGTTNIVPVEIATRFSDTVIVSTTFYEGKGISLNNPLSLLNVSMDAAKRRQGVSSLLENPQALWIRCDVEDFSFMDFDKVDELSRNGYTSSMAIREKLLPFASEDNEFDTRSESRFQDTHEQVLDQYMYFRLPQLSGFSHLIFTGVKNFPEGIDGSSSLRQEILAGLRYTFRAPGAELSVLAGAAWQPYTDNDLYPEVVVEAWYLPLSSVMLQGTYLASAQDDGSWSHYMAGRVRVHQLALSRTLTIQEGVSVEGNLDSSFSFTEVLAEGTAALAYRREWDLDATVSYQLWDTFSRQFLHADISARFPLCADVTLRPASTVRFALDGGGDVPYFIRDGYYTPERALLDQGHSGSAPNGTDYLAVLSLQAEWNPQAFRPTIGELLIFKNSSLGAFAQLLWWQESDPVPEVSAGVQVKSLLGFIGLKDLPLHLFIGYDTLSDGIIGGIGIAGEFR